MEKNETRPLSYIIHKNKLKRDKGPECETGNHPNPRGESRKKPLWPQPQQFLDTSPKARELKAKMNYWDLINIKRFCTAKETINKTKRQPTEWENIFANYILDKGLLSKIYKELTKLHTWKTNNPVKKWAEDMNRYLSKEDIQMTNRHMKRCSTSLIIREIQNKTTLRHHFIHVKVAKMNKSGDCRCWQGCGETGTRLQCWWECKLVQLLWKTIWRFLKKLKIEIPYNPLLYC